nr:hypothetical protein [uncultured Anaerobutyricum sp.]
MKITRCKYGHYYDKAYFRECPHCCRKRGGRDEDIIIEPIGLSTTLSRQNGDSNKIVNGDVRESQKEKDRENVKRWIGEAWDELEEILNEDEKTSIESPYKEEQVEVYEERPVQREKLSTEKIEKENSNVEIEIKEQSKKLERDKRIYINKEDFMLFVAMPLKVIKNQEFCMDFCFFPENKWETGAKMLAFKSQESIRDLKSVRMSLPANGVLHILYKDEEILSKEIQIDEEKTMIFSTFPVTVTDTRDRRFHMIKVVFAVAEQDIEIPLYLMPNP